MTIASKLREFLPTVYERYGALNARQYAYRSEAAGIINTSKGKKKPFDYVNSILVDLREDSVLLPWMLKLAGSGKIVQILYLGDVDDEGFQIPLTLLNTMSKWIGRSPQFDIHDLYPRHPPEVKLEGSVIRFKRLALMPEQVEKMNLSKLEVNPKSSIAHKFVDFKCELEAMEPDMLRKLIKRSIDECWDEKAERDRKAKVEELRGELKRRIGELTKDWNGKKGGG